MILKKIDGTEQDVVVQSDYADLIIQQFDDGLYAPYISKDDKIFLDIGANIGLFGAYVAPQADRVIGVEPTPEHNENAKRILPPWTDIEESALSDETGTALFYRNPVNSTNNSLEVKDSEPFQVPCITLINLCRKYNLDHVDFCKIDIEGSEWKAITKETLQPVYEIIDKIFIELHPMDSSSQDKMIPILESVGYKVERVGNDTLFAHK